MSLLTVLGVTQDGGHPQTGCTKPCCARAWEDPSLGHRIASLGIRDGDRAFIVDCTPDFPEQLRAIGGPPLDGILLTHAHMGHYTGLLQVGPEAWAPRKLPVYVMPGMRKFLTENAPWSALMERGHVELRDLTDGRPLVLTDHVTVTPWTVPHRGPWTETVGFVIAGPQRKVLFVPDIDRWDDWERDVSDVVASVDVAYFDGSFYTLDELDRPDASEILHPLVTDTMDRLQHLPADLRGRVRFIHLNHTNPLLDPESEAFRHVHDRGYRVAIEGEQVVL